MFSVVISGSREPTVDRGDVIIWVPAEAEDMEVGDVAIYSSYVQKGTTISHRITNITYKNGQPYFITKGDANNYTDQAGAHAPEPKVGPANLLGKALTVGEDKRLFKIPYGGWVMLLASDFFSSLTDHLSSGSKGSSTFQVGVLLPMIGSVGMLIGAVVVLNPRKDEKRDMVQLVFGPENVRMRRVFAYAATMFILFLVSTAFFAFDEVTTSMTVKGKTHPDDRGRLNIDKLQPGEQENRTLPINAPALLGVKGLVFTKGHDGEWIDVNGTLFYVDARQKLLNEISINVPENTSRGTYNNVSIFIYSQPYWVVLPDSLMEPIIEWNPHGAVIVFDILSALVLAVISVLLLALIAIVTDAIGRWKVYAAWSGLKLHPRLAWIYKRLGGPRTVARFKRELHPKTWLKDLDWYRFDPTIPLAAGAGGALAGLLLVLNGRIFEGVFVGALTSGALAYLLGCTYRPQVVLAGVTAQGVLVGLVLATAVALPTSLEPLVLVVFLGQLGAIFAIIFLVLLFPVAWLSYLGAFLLHSARMRYDPEKALQVNSDL